MWRRDKFYLRAKKEGFRARSVYKLEELNKKFKIIKKGDKILDLGCCPGSWMQAAVKIAGKGNAVGIDILKMKPIDGSYFVLGDVFDDEKIDEVKKIIKEFDVVICDIAPKSTGLKDIDRYNALRLNKRSLEVARGLLKKEGRFLCKVFQHTYLNEFINEVKKSFKKFKITKPVASRKESSELYLICSGKN